MKKKIPSASLRLEIGENTYIGKNCAVQVNGRIGRGVLILTGLLLGWLVAPAFVALTVFVGLGLTFAGLSGFCGMARLLALMPWNRRSLS